MKNCHNTLPDTVQDLRLFSGLVHDNETMPTRSFKGPQTRRRRSNHQTSENSQFNSAMKQTRNSHIKFSSIQTQSPAPAQTTGVYNTTMRVTRRQVSRAAQRLSSSSISSNNNNNKSTVVNGAMPRHRPNSGWSRPLSLGGLLVTLALTSCLLVSHTTSAFENNAQDPSHATSKSSSQELAASRPNERSDGPSKADSTLSSSSSSSAPEKSIVASLSSAVASAAAAAAVAAAQSSLSSSDARSLSTGSANHHHHHNHNQHAHGTQRSPGMNLAIKLVDTIPEVPYNILHNMKKLDHAAPFYNVPNKLTGGTTKESSPAQNLLSTALAATSSGNFGGAAEQLSSLFKSPIWKRLADGYGDFASEFRSLFRAPGATPMKGPASPTSKLIRDISVPALLMLLASSISGEWRPVRTRRKSFRPVDLSSAATVALQGGNGGQQQQQLQQGSAPAFLAADMKSASPQHYLSSAQQFAEPPQPQSFDQYYSGSAPQAAIASAAPATAMPLNNFAPPSSGEWLDQQQQVNAARQALNQQQQLQQVGPLVRVNGDNNLQPPQPSGAGAQMDSAPSNWISSMQTAGGGGGQDHQQQSAIYNQQPAAALARRSDEIVAASSAANKRPLGPVSLATLATVTQGGKLISKLLNTGDDGNSYRMMMGLVNGRGDKISPSAWSIKRRDQLSDKQRYSLVGSAEELSAKQQQQPRLLSAMAHAVTSMLHPASVGGKSGSAASAAAEPSSHSSAAPARASAVTGFLSRGNLQNLIISDKTINHHEDAGVFMRRQPQQAEQRDLTKLLPEAWRDVVKRTMTTVQQQANTQWKSIEGQLTNWVQDKLKTVAASASPGAPGGSSAGGGGASGGSVPAPLGNMLASMSSTALNIFGLNKNNNSSSPSTTAAAATAAATTALQASQAKSQPAGDESSGATANQRGKIDQTKAAGQSNSQQPAKGALAGVASMLVNVISDRNNKNSNNPPRQSSSPSVSSSSSSYPSLPKFPSNAHDASAQKSQTLGDLAASILASTAVSSVASKYPTLTGSQPKVADSQDKTPLAPVTALAPLSSTQQPQQHSSSPPAVPSAQATPAVSAGGSGATRAQGASSDAAHPLDL